MRVALFTLTSVLCAAAAFSTTVYKWVDENGVMHFSDQPHENAQKVQVAPPQTYKAPKVQAPVQPESQQGGDANTYECQVVSPENDETLPNAYSVTATVRVNPTPHDGDQVLLLLDGTPVPAFPRGGGSLTISNMDRGTHTLKAIVQDASGKPVCQSPNVTFTILQPSILNPANPNFRR